MDLINTVALKVNEQHTVDLSEPQLVILVNVIKVFYFLYIKEHLWNKYGKELQ